jgi:hypothetical protein
MFNSLSKTRQPPTHAARRQRANRRARPLAVEAVEGRLMLASDWLDFVPSNIPAVSGSLTFDLRYSTSDQTIQFIGQAQGGFVAPVVSPTGELMSGSLVLPDGAQVTGGPFELFTGGMLRLNNGGSFTNWFDFGGVDAANGNLRPVVIAFDDSQPVSQLNSDSILARGDRTQTSRNEGGPIPIESILAKDNPNGGFDPGNRRLLVENAEEPVKVTQLASESRDESSPLARPVAMQSPSPLKVALAESRVKNDARVHIPISGEWARAMVFEVAGGEPVNILRPAQNGSRLNSAPVDDSTADAHRPLLNTGAQLDANRAIKAASDKLNQSAVPEVELLEQPLTRPTDFTGIVAAQLNAFARGQNWDKSATDFSLLSLVALTAGNPLPQARGLANGNLSDDASSEVFAHLGESEATSLRAADDEDAFGESSYVAPILLVLALEQANAAKVRRAKTRATLLAWPPRGFARESND